MNVAYDQISTADAAKMLKVDKTTVAYWCRNGIINFVNVSDGNNKGRYMLTEDEVEPLGVVEEETPVPVKEKKKFDLDSVMTTISYMQDIKERMEDIMAEYNQLENEYHQLKQEVNDLI